MAHSVFLRAGIGFDCRRHAAGLRALLPFLADAAFVRRADSAGGTETEAHGAVGLFVLAGGLQQPVLVDSHGHARCVGLGQCVCRAAHVPDAGGVGAVSRAGICLVAQVWRFAHAACGRGAADVVDAGGICARATGAGLRFRLGRAGLFANRGTQPAGRVRANCGHSRGYLGHSGFGGLAGAFGGHGRLERTGESSLHRCPDSGCRLLFAHAGIHAKHGQTRFRGGDTGQYRAAAEI